MTVGELNTKIVIKAYTTTQDQTTGDISAALTGSWSKWVKTVEQSSNGGLSNGSDLYRQSWQFTGRYEQSRKTLEGYVLEYKDQILKVDSVIKQYEGFVWYEVITAFAIK